MTTSFQNQNSFSPLFSFITFLFLLLNNNQVVVNSLEEVEFSFDTFITGQKSLVLQGDALITSTGHLQLTNVDTTGEPVDHSVGRALYSSPIHIWDSTTGIVGDFEAYFTFVINAPNTAEAAEGLAFFIAPENTQPQEGGGQLGIYPGNVVAVEFDTFYNEKWDVEGPHIGINVRSAKSKNTTQWDFVSGEEVIAKIVYSGRTKTLYAFRVSPLGPEYDILVTAVVDLKKVFPGTEYVRIGLSAATGLNKDHVETHDVLSWSFLSVLPDSLSDEAIISKEKRSHLSPYNVLSKEIKASKF